MIELLGPGGWAGLGSAAVGAVLLWAAALKAVEPAAFLLHVRRVGVGHRTAPPAVVLAVAGEAAWGGALLLGLWPGVLLPASMVLLGGLAWLTWWSTSTGRTDDCGCYGGRVEVSPGQSLALDGLYVALIGLSWWRLETPVQSPEWGPAAVLASGLAMGALAVVRLARSGTDAGAVAAATPLKVGRRWRPRWAAGSVDGAGETLVVFLGPSCPHCHRWSRLLNVVHRVDGLPAVVGVVGGHEGEVEDFVAEHALRFPVAAVHRARAARLAPAVPTSALVQDGVIRRVWVGSVPDEEFQDRFKAAIFPGLRSDQPSEGGGGTAGPPA